MPFVRSHRRQNRFPVTGNRVVAFILLRIVYKGLCGIGHIIPILLPAKILAEIDGLRIAMPFPWPTTR